MEINHIEMIARSFSNPQVRRRLDTLRGLVISIGKRKGWVCSSMNQEQALKIVFKKLDGIKKKAGGDKAWLGSRTEKKVGTREPAQKEFHIRLPESIWYQIREEARKIKITPTRLVERWILEALNKVALKSSVYRTARPTNPPQIKGSSRLYFIF